MAYLYKVLQENHCVVFIKNYFFHIEDMILIDTIKQNGIEWKLKLMLGSVLWKEKVIKKKKRGKKNQKTKL